MALEDERAAFGASSNGAVGVVKEGNLNVLKSDPPTLFDNLKVLIRAKNYEIRLKFDQK